MVSTLRRGLRCLGRLSDAPWRVAPLAGPGGWMRADCGAHSFAPCGQCVPGKVTTKPWRHAGSMLPIDVGAACGASDSPEPCLIRSSGRYAAVSCHEPNVRRNTVASEVSSWLMLLHPLRSGHVALCTSVPMWRVSVALRSAVAMGASRGGRMCSSCWRLPSC